MDEVRRLRKMKGLSQVELAELGGVSAYTVTEIETGRRDPHGSTLRKLAKALEVDVSNLFREEPSPPKAQAPPPEEGVARYVVPAEDLARLFRNLARRGRRIVEQSVKEGASEELSREAADYHKEGATLLKVKGGRDIRGKDPEDLAEAVEDYEEVEARIQSLLAQDLSADAVERAGTLRFKKGKGGGYTEERGADAS